MKVLIRLAEPYWRAVGTRELDLELLPNTSIKTMVDKLSELYPKLADEMSTHPPLVFIGEDEVKDDALLSEGNRVHMVWPISGGEEGSHVL